MPEKRTRDSSTGQNLQDQEPGDGGSYSANTELQDVFQRHFETRFQPLQKKKKNTQSAPAPAPVEEDTSSMQEESEWSGISDSGSKSQKSFNFT